MLVYANNISCHGSGAGGAIFKAVGVWLKEQLGFGLHPEQLKKDGEYTGYRGDTRSWLRISSTDEEEPKLYAWVLRTYDDKVMGRIWVTELGLKIYAEEYQLSCVVRTDEQSTLVANPVVASRPRLIRYVAENVSKAKDAQFSASVSGVSLKTVGADRDSYRGFLAEIERRDRNSPIVIVSPNSDGIYSVDAIKLQQDLFGLAQVIKVHSEFNSYEMEEVLGRKWSAWGGAINVLNAPTASGYVRNKIFLFEEITEWGIGHGNVVANLLAWVTNSTNVDRQRNQIRPEGVTQLALRRRLTAVRNNSAAMNAQQLAYEIETAARLAAEQSQWIAALEADNSKMAAEALDLTNKLGEAEELIRRKSFEINSLKDQFSGSGGNRASAFDVSSLLDLLCRNSPPTPSECIQIIETLHGDKCIVLETAKSSARDMNKFVYGRNLMSLLLKLVTDYRNSMISGGDNAARAVFGKSEYAAKESKTVMDSKALVKARTFSYNGKQLEMFRHLKIGVADDLGKTIRVHFDWDAEKRIVVIGYCGEHLPISSH